MNTTMIDRPAEARQQLRRDVELFIDWVMSRPTELAFAPSDTAPLAAKVVGHDVDPDALLEVIVAVGVRDRYRGSDVEIAAQQSRVDAAIDALLDVRRCEACGGVIADGTSFVDCNETGLIFDSHDCHDAHHAPCLGGSDRA